MSLAMEHLEGRQSILAALSARRRRFEVILISQSAHQEKVHDVLEAARIAGVPVKMVSGRDLDAMAHGATHGGVLAVCSARPLTTEKDLLEILDRQPSSPLLLLEGAEDARNLGFTLRSAEALGAAAVLIKKHLWDFDSVEVARPASGAFERLPLLRFEGTELIQRLQSRPMRLLGCIAEAKQTVYQADLTGGTILAIGGEKRGLSGAVRRLCDAFVSIPTAPGAASLPLSHAAAVVLAEAHRQRLASGKDQ
jgi:23S rRNA (guanosine2251-2'-O)-methyltransferase